MYYWDPTYLLVIIGMLLCMGASAMVNSAMNRYSKVRNARGMTGAEAARLNQCLVPAQDHAQEDQRHPQTARDIHHRHQSGPDIDRHIAGGPADFEQRGAVQCAD